MTIEEVQHDIVEQFAQFDDWMDKYSLLIDIGKRLPPVSEQIKVDQNLIKGCQSKVWIDARYQDGCIYFDADSNTEIVKGIVSILMSILSGRTPTEIMEAQLFFAEQTGLSKHLSPTRANGLLSMIKQVKLYAMAFNAKYGGN